MQLDSTGGRVGAAAVVVASKANSSGLKRRLTVRARGAMVGVPSGRHEGIDESTAGTKRRVEVAIRGGLGKGVDRLPFSVDSATTRTMSAANVQYTRELRKRFGYSATWVPTSEVRLGDVGRLQRYEFERIATLADFGVQFARRDGSTSASLDYTSAHGVSFAIKASGELPPLGSGLAALDAGIVVSFGVKDGIVLQAAGCVVAQVENQHELAKQILALYEDGEWPDDYVAVTEVVQAERTTVLISSSSDGSVAFKTKGDAELGPMSLAAVDVGLQVSRSRNIGTQILGEGGLTPLFKAHGVRKRWLQPPALARRGTRPPPASPEGSAILDEVDYEDFA